MAWFPDLPIGRKLMLVGVATSVLALAVASAIFFVTTVVALREDIRNALMLQAIVLADNVASSVAFGDTTTAEETLAALKNSSTIDAACIYEESGRLFLGYVATGRADKCPQEASQTAAFIDGGVHIDRPVLHRGRRYGTLYMHGNFSEVASRLAAHTVGALIAIALGVIAALLLSARIQRVVSRPLRDLSSTAVKITQAGDYSLRATKRSEDEIGQLVDTFNTMLTEVERRDEQLRAASRLKDEFLAALSHELRTPLNGVLGWIQVLRGVPHDPVLAARAYASIERNARAQAALIEDLLDISRIVTGKLHFRAEPIDLTAVIDAALEVVRPAAEAKQVTIDRVLLAPPQYVLGDAHRLQQIAWNLLSNAVKFSTPGGRVHVSLARDGGNYLLEVRDEGVGISPEFLPHVFDRFRQADGSTTRIHGGLGLGLAIARELTILHGGRIEARSAGVGRGTTLAVTLPRSNVLPLTGVPDGTTGAALAGLLVLVVDDDEDTRELARIVLSTAGAVVVPAGSAADAIRALGSRQPGIILCDLAMPGMDGFELLRTIREGRTPASASTPAIAVSAHAGAAVERRVLESGFQAFVAKPYDIDVLVDAISRVLSHA